MDDWHDQGATSLDAAPAHLRDALCLVLDVDDLVAARGGDPVKTWQGLVRRYFEGGVKPPFNIPAREAAGFSAAFYGPLGEEFLDRGGR